MTLSRPARFLLGVLAIWLALGTLAVILFHWPGAHPGKGRGDPIGLSRTP